MSLKKRRIIQETSEQRLKMCCEAEMAAQSLYGRWMHQTKIAEFFLKNVEPVPLSYCNFCALDEALSTLVSG